MTIAPTLADQRAALVTALEGLTLEFPYKVYPMPVDDPVPACIVVENPSLLPMIGAAAHVWNANWTVRLLGQRVAPEAMSNIFDEWVMAVLAALRTARFTVDSAEFRTYTQSGYGLPTYFVSVTAQVAVC